MKASRAIIPLLALSSLLGFSSCGTMKSIKSTASAGAGKVSGGFGKMSSGMGSMAGNVGDFAKNTKSKVLPSHMPVVEAREDDLRDIPTGHDRALAYQQKRNRKFRIFGGPIKFEEPELPEIGEGSSAGLLPPKPG